MGWTIALLGVILAAINGQVGLLLFVIGIVMVVASTGGPSKPVPAGAKSIGALVMLLVGALAFMAAVAAVVGAASSF